MALLLVCYSIDGSLSVTDVSITSTTPPAAAIQAVSDGGDDGSRYMSCTSRCLWEPLVCLVHCVVLCSLNVSL